MSDKTERNNNIVEEEAVCEDKQQADQPVPDADAAEPAEKAAEAPAEPESAEAKLAAVTDRLMRTAAEFDKYKKRTAKEREELFQMGICEAVEKLLPVLDNLERAIEAGEQNEDKAAFLDGVRMIQKQFVDALSGIGVEKIEAVGTPFDPEKHNAVMTEESDQPENTVIEELMKGYRYKDKIVRHSMVKVSC